MTRYAYSFVAPSDRSSDRSQSPPPPYATRPPSVNYARQPPSRYPTRFPSPRSRRNEQTPLLRRKKGSKPSLTLECFPWPLCFLIHCILFIFAVVALYLCKALLRTFPHSPSFYSPPTYSIAIVGSGPAGISALQHLHLESRKVHIRLNITLFESAPLVGGQLALNDSTGGPVFPYDDPNQDPIKAEDITGSALIWGNPLFTKTSEAILGDRLEFSERNEQEASYISGDRIVSQTTRPYRKTPLFKWMGLIFHYGSSVWQAGGLANEGTQMRDRFVDAPLTPDIIQLMISLGILDPVREFAQHDLDSRGIGGAYETEILGPQVERVHSQGIPNISTLAMMLAAGQEDYANAYVGGELIDRLEQIVAATGADVRTGTKVSAIKHEQINSEQSAWLVAYDAPGLPFPGAEPFDRVILAAPSFDLYQASPLDDAEAASVLTYRSTHVTFFTLPERLNPDDFGSGDQILFHDAQGKYDAFKGVRELAFVREVGRLVDGHTVAEHLYCALSDDDITEEIRNNLGVTWLYQTRLENAHPDLYPFRRFPPFKLSDKGMWWTSAIHAIASTVDMSWLAGRIVAEDILKDLPKPKS
ncbi:hypothetical protein F5Y05DRAFT_421055 [Hypoxylon sp. FL0543]|nr:hypothetical protein F5Y05DRAFT_421055 [Hypoxylon sp. FL0543]